MREQAAEIMRIAAEARAELSAVVLLGMGGSSLAPEVLVQSFGVETSTFSTRPIRGDPPRRGAARSREHALRLGVQVGLDDRDALAH